MNRSVISYPSSVDAGTVTITSAGGVVSSAGAVVVELGLFFLVTFGGVGVGDGGAGMHAAVNMPMIANMSPSFFIRKSVQLLRRSS